MSEFPAKFFPGTKIGQLLTAAKVAITPDNLLDWQSLTEHAFLPGLYIRKFTLPADAFVIGKIHLTEHAFVMVEGIVEVLDEQGNVTVMGAPQAFVSPPGSQRAIYAYEKAVFLTVHKTELTDVAEIEAQIMRTPVELLT